jgi:hypothetical protein
LFGTAFADVGSREVVAVAPFTGTGLAGAEAEVPEVVSSLVQNSIFQDGGVTVVERAQLVEVLLEVQFQQSGLCDVDCAVDIGSQLEADKVVLGEVTKLGETYIVRGRLVDVAARDILTNASVACVGQDELLAKTPTLALTLLGIEKDVSESTQTQVVSSDARVSRYFDYNTLYLYDEIETGVRPEGSCQLNFYGCFPLDYSFMMPTGHEQEFYIKLDKDEKIRGPFSRRVMFVKPGQHLIKITASGKLGAGPKLSFEAPANGCLNVLISPNNKKLCFVAECHEPG